MIPVDGCNVVLIEKSWQDGFDGTVGEAEFVIEGVVERSKRVM